MITSTDMSVNGVNSARVPRVARTIRRKHDGFGRLTDLASTTDQLTSILPGVFSLSTDSKNTDNENPQACLILTRGGTRLHTAKNVPAT